MARLDAHGLTLLRRARGFAPLPLPFPKGSRCVLAMGGHLKSTVALSVGDRVVVSQHLGDLESAEGAGLHERTVSDLLRFFEAVPEVIACDLHPDYASTRLAERMAASLRVPLERVQHHHAHVAAVMAEHGVDDEILGLAWDGTGLGDDGTIWGGEALVCKGAHYRRLCPLLPFPLPGGDLAAREPRRAALGLLYSVMGAAARQMARPWFDPSEFDPIFGALVRGVNAPPTTSIGRLFDAVSALCGVSTKSAFEGEAAMRLEFAAAGLESDEAYSITIDLTRNMTDWRPLIDQIRTDLAGGIPVALMSVRFHNALARLAVDLARASGVKRVALCGGCFQNERLSRRCGQALAAAGFEVLRPARMPPNDGAISLGQALIAARRRPGT